MTLGERGRRVMATVCSNDAGFFNSLNVDATESAGLLKRFE